jgi:two-component system CheB/CheR fusion protein
METYLQKTALTNFHYALAPKGYLLLGKAETTDPLADHYLIFDKKQKVYSRKDVAAKFVHIPKPKLDIPANLPQPFTRKKKIQTDFRKTADDIMLKNFTPAGVVINESFDIVHFRGDTKPYLQQSDGKPTHNILNLATS